MKVTLYTGAFCGYCMMAKRLLKQLGLNDIDEIRVDTDPEQFAIMQQRSGRRSVPQIFIGDTHIGGFTDLQAWQRDGRLAGLLSGSPHE